MRIEFFFTRNMRIIFVIKLEKYIANMIIFDIIINKLPYKKELYLIILFDINKDSKIDFHYTIPFLNLTIYLKIERG